MSSKFQIFSEAIFYSCIAINDKGEPWLEHPEGPIGDHGTSATICCSRSIAQVFCPLYITNSVFASKFLKLMGRISTFRFSNKFSVMHDVDDALFKEHFQKLDMLLSLSATNTVNLSGEVFVDAILSPKLSWSGARYFRCWFDFDHFKKKEEGSIETALRKNAEFATALVRVLAPNSTNTNERIRKSALDWITRMLFNPSADGFLKMNDDARDGVVDAGCIPFVCNGILSSARHHKLHPPALHLLQRLTRRNTKLSVEQLEPILKQLTEFCLIHPATEIRKDALWCVDSIFEGKAPTFFLDPRVRPFVGFVAHQFLSEERGLGEIQYGYADEDCAQLNFLRRKAREEAMAGGAAAAFRAGDSDDDDDDPRAAPRRNMAPLTQALCRCVSRIFGAAARNSSEDLLRFLISDCRVFDSLADLLLLLPNTEHQNILEDLEQETAKRHEKNNNGNGRPSCAVRAKVTERSDLPLITAHNTRGARRDIYVCVTLAAAISLEWFMSALQCGFLKAILDDCGYFKSAAEQRKIRNEQRALLREEASSALAAAGASDQEIAAAADATDSSEKKKEDGDEDDSCGDFPAQGWAEVVSFTDDVIDNIMNHVISRAQQAAAGSGDPRTTAQNALGAFIVESSERYAFFKQCVSSALEYVVFALPAFLKRRKAARVKREAKKEKRTNEQESEEPPQNEEEPVESDDLPWSLSSLQQACRIASLLMHCRDMNDEALAEAAHAHGENSFVQIALPYVQQIAPMLYEDMKDTEYELLQRVGLVDLVGRIVTADEKEQRGDDSDAEMGEQLSSDE